MLFCSLAALSIGKKWRNHWIPNLIGNGHRIRFVSRFIPFIVFHHVFPSFSLFLSSSPSCGTSTCSSWKIGTDLQKINERDYGRRSKTEVVDLFCRPAKKMKMAGRWTDLKRFRERKRVSCWALKWKVKLLLRRGVRERESCLATRTWSLLHFFGLKTTTKKNGWSFPSHTKWVTQKRAFRLQKGLSRSKLFETPCSDCWMCIRCSSLSKSAGKSHPKRRRIFQPWQQFSFLLIDC